MKILFVCEYNACRSQMAEGIARHLLPGTVSVQSAGVYPGEVHIWTMDVMQEIGIDISSHRSKQLDAMAGERFDYLVVLAEPALERTTIIEATHRLPWFHPDPTCDPGEADEVKVKIRRVREAIRQQIEAFSVNA